MCGEKDAPSSLQRVVMGQGRKVIFIGNKVFLFSLLVKQETHWFFFFSRNNEGGVDSTVTAGREGPDLGLFQKINL